MITKAQQIMIDDGFPESGFVAPADRQADWKGRKLTPSKFFVDKKTSAKPTDPGTLEVLAIEAAKAKAKLKAKKAAQKEARLAQQRRKTKPPATPAITSEDDTTMAKKAAKKTAKKTVAANGRKAEVITMLQRPNGVTVAQICKSTGMLEHSARALISGIRKSNTVETTKAGDAPTVYFIKA